MNPLATMTQEKFNQLKEQAPKSEDVVEYKQVEKDAVEYEERVEKRMVPTLKEESYIVRVPVMKKQAEVVAVDTHIEYMPVQTVKLVRESKPVKRMVTFMESQKFVDEVEVPIVHTEMEEREITITEYVPV